MMAVIFILWLVDPIILIIIACIIQLSTILYILYYLYRNPPSQYDAGPSPVFE